MPDQSTEATLTVAIQDTSTAGAPTHRTYRPPKAPKPYRTRRT
jgi:hypothetical protein